MKTNRNQKRAGLKVRTDIRAGAYFSIVFGAGGGSASVSEAAPAAPPATE
jgi:hypothetical protein